MAHSTDRLSDRLSIVIITHNRASEVLRTLTRLHGLAQTPPLVVVDNGSQDNTATLILRHFPQVRLIRLRTNLGAAARNVGVKAVATPYVAFCDDDTWWAPGALEQGCALLDAHPHVAVLSARVLVGAEAREDPTCTLMAASTLPSARLPGPAIMGFLAGASIFRRQAFLDAGGYNQHLFIGGEEALLTLDLAARGWQLVYVPQLLVHHYPSAARDSRYRQQLLIRNAIWIAWMRRPFFRACEETIGLLATALRQHLLFAILEETVPGMPWALKNRRVIPREVELLYRQRTQASH